jgi:tetratricopeptide (TPR) repeat protein
VDSLGWAYYKLGRTNEALQQLQRATQLMPDDAVIEEHLGEVYIKSHRLDDAKAAWSKSLSLDPTNQKLRARFEAEGFGAAPRAPAGSAAAPPDTTPYPPSSGGQNETAVSKPPAGI